MRVLPRPIFGTMLVWSGLSASVTAAAALQDPVPVYHYSTLTATFDDLLPIGQRFQIRGAVPASVDAVRVESFGFQGPPPTGLREGAANVVAFCAALKQARGDAQKTVLYSTIGWDRTEPGSVEFSVSHPRLYYGRNYTFVFTLYRKVDKEQVRTLLARGLEGAIRSAPGFETLLRKGSSGAEQERTVAAAIIAALQRAEISCGPLVVARDPSDVLRFWQQTRDAMATAIAELATRSKDQDILDTRGAAARDSLRAGIEALPDALKAEPPVSDAMTRANTAAEKADWSGAADALSDILKLISSLRRDGRLSESDAKIARTNLTPAAAALAEPAAAHRAIAQKVSAAPDSVAKKIAESYQPPDLNDLLSAATVLPYFETMKEALPFLISLDGGLSYVARFRELMPIAGANIKLNRVDFDDPLDHRSEFSVLIGLGLSSPDDLDPDYEGIFSGSNRSLWFGLGLRPGFAPLLRGNVGLLLFRQRDENPLQKDLHTRVSLAFGLSANWDALDFAANLMKGRPTLGGGGL